MSVLSNSNAITTTGGAYNITDSLRIRQSASGYLERTPTTSGSTTTATWSFWIKLADISGTTNTCIFEQGATANNRVSIYYRPNLGTYNYTFQFFYAVGASYTQIIPNAKFRDPSAWYHVVVVLDTTNATANDRMRMYVNGEQITSFELDNRSSVTQNQTTQLNTTDTVRIGSSSFSVANPLDAYLSEFNFVDGQALTASDFGEYNTDGVWSPKKYTGTYGTNGFYLPMKETTQATGFNTVLYTGTGSNQSITGVGFNPDLLWVKSRTSAINHRLADSVRGATQLLSSDVTNAEVTSVNGLQSFDADGFTVGTGTAWNTSGADYVTWCWDAGSSTVSNTDGTITSSVRANPATGFSIVTWTGNGVAGATIGHGLGTAPSVVITKGRSYAQNWAVYHSALGPTKWLQLNSSVAQLTETAIWNNTAPTSSVFTHGNSVAVNPNGGTNVSYCFSEVAGYSKFGSYTGNGSTSGPTITTGFRPAFVMVKRSDSTGSWVIFDNTRDADGTLNDYLLANTSDTEATASYADISDTGFTINSTFANASGATFIYMAFADTRDYQWNFDASGNKNNWTPNNINSNASSETTYDLMSDVPSLANEDTANFATLNPSVGTAGVTNVTLSEANLKYENSDVTYRRYIPSTISIAPSSGKFYCEGVYTVSSQAAYDCFGIADATLLGEGNRGASNVVGIWSYRRNGNADIENTGGATGITYGDSWAVGDVIGIAYDSDTGSLTFYKNGVSQGQLVTGIDITVCFFVAGFSNCDAYMNFGQRPFAYTPPTGYKKLNTYNLPDSSITDGSKYMNTVTYTGNGSTQSITGVGFSPDFVWLKNRSIAQIHGLFDSVRGAGKLLSTNNTSAEISGAPGVSSFNSDGFELGNVLNNNTNAFVAWNWRGSDSTAVSNTDGTITSTVSANTTSGFSVVTFTGTGATGTVGHGLSQAPEIYIRKSRSNAEDWYVYTTVIDGSLDYLILNNTNAKANSGASLPNATTFEVGAGESSGEQLVTYCFHSVEGFSKMGTYTGNGSTDGPFVYTGFRPAFIMFKRTDAVVGWEIYDTARDTYNPYGLVLAPNGSGAEADVRSGYPADMLSNGFKIRHNGGAVNANGGTYVYMAFAENPFKNSLAR